MQFGIKTFLMTGLMAVLFIVMIKVIFTKYPVSGVSELVQAV